MLIVKATARWMVIGIFFAAATAATASSDSSPIELARQQALGSAVTVEGVVTVPSGTFAPNDTGFAIADHKAGLYVHASGDAPRRLGERVRVTGTLANNFGQVLGISPMMIEPLGSAPAPAPRPLKTGMIDEASEGRLVTVKGTIVGPLINDAPYGWKFDLDDGSGVVMVFIYAGAEIDISALAPGQKTTVSGFSGQFRDHYEVNPRFQSDIRSK